MTASIPDAVAGDTADTAPPTPTTPADAPVLHVYADSRSEEPLFALPVGGTPAYAPTEAGERLRVRVASLGTHEALPPGWERDAATVRDLGKLLARTHSVTWTERGKTFRVPPAGAQLGWFFASSVRGNVPLTVAALLVLALGTLPVALRQPPLLVAEWVVFIGVALARVYYPPWVRTALVLPEPDEPGEYRMLAVARYDLRLAPLFRRRSWPVAPRRFFLWVGTVAVVSLLAGFVLPVATTIYQELAFGCLMLLLPLMQVVRGWIGDRKYVLFESQLDDYDSLPRYNPAVNAFLDRVLAEPETVVIADETFQTVGPLSPFAEGAAHRPVEGTFVARKVAATSPGAVGRLRDAAYGRTRDVKSDG